MVKKISKIDKAIEIIKDNCCMINSILSPDELKVFNDDFTGYLERALEARKFQIQTTQHKDIEEQGLLLKLPCKVGDKLWAITSTANYSLGRYNEVLLEYPQEKKIQSITISNNGVRYHVNGRTYGIYDFGKTVFLTREEAESGLAKMKNIEEAKDKLAEEAESIGYLSKEEAKRMIEQALAGKKEV